jgi:hypothetical protein
MKFSRKYNVKLLDKSTPNITESMAWRIQMDDFDVVHRMATFDVTKFEHHVSTTMTDVAKIFEVLEKVVDPEIVGVTHGWGAQEGVAGSASLAVLESIMSRTRSGELRGRWRKEGVFGDETGGVGDVDFFVCRRNGGTPALFRTYVAAAISKIVKLVAKEGRIVTVDKEMVHPYLQGGAILIQNIWISGVSVKLSFVQAPSCRHMMDVVDMFDINVVKVIYNPYRKELYVPLDVVCGVENGLADVCDFHLNKGSPSSYDLMQVKLSLKRMNKYGNRGYYFKKYPKLMMSGYSERTRVQPGFFTSKTR